MKRDLDPHQEKYLKMMLDDVEWIEYLKANGHADKALVVRWISIRGEYSSDVQHIRDHLNDTCRMYQLYKRGIIDE